jgi:hypothetical protein
MKKIWWKGALLVSMCSLFQLTGGCLGAAIQRILVAVNFD